MLRKIFEMQEEFDKLVAQGLVEEGAVVPDAFHRLVAATHEIIEAQNELGWKWWKDTEPNIPKAKEEMVDVLFFLVSAMLAIGMGPDEMFALYRAKWLVNVERQRCRGNNGTVKHWREDELWGW